MIALAAAGLAVVGLVLVVTGAVAVTVSLYGTLFSADPHARALDGCLTVFWLALLAAGVVLLMLIGSL